MNSEEIWNTIHANIPKWVEDVADDSSQKSDQTVAAAKPCVLREPVMVLGAYNIKFNGDNPVGE